MKMLCLYQFSNGFIDTLFMKINFIMSLLTTVI